MVQKSVDPNIEITLFKKLIHTPVGLIGLYSDGVKIVKVHFEEPGSVVETKEEKLPECLEICALQLEEYFAGKRSVFELPLAAEGTEFQQKVWRQLMKIPFGKTICYADMAGKLGDPKLIRAAASANGKNPIAIIIPCHRVIGANGDLVGYAGGLPIKKWLLEHEMKHYSGISQLSIF